MGRFFVFAHFGFLFFNEKWGVQKVVLCFYFITTIFSHLYSSACLVEEWIKYRNAMKWSSDVRSGCARWGRNVPPLLLQWLWSHKKQPMGSSCSVISYLITSVSVIDSASHRHTWTAFHCSGHNCRLVEAWAMSPELTVSDQNRITLVAPPQQSLAAVVWNEEVGCDCPDPSSHKKEEDQRVDRSSSKSGGWIGIVGKCGVQDTPRQFHPTQRCHFSPPYGW